MKKILAFLLFLGLLAPSSYSDSTTTANTPADKTTAPEASVGNTTSSNEAFLTLTRTAIPIQDLPTNTEIITPEEIKTYNAVDAGEAVRHATSVQILPLGGSGALETAHIRGSLSSQVLVLIDGRPASGYALGPSDLSEIPEESIDHIEIVRGGASALYGPNAMGGVINVITKRSAGKTTADVQARYSSYGKEEYRFNAGSKYDGIDYYLYGNQTRDSGFRTNSDSRLYNIGGNVGIPIEGAGKFTLDASAMHNEIGLSGFVFPDIPPNQFNNNVEKLATTPNARQDTTRRTLQAAYSVPLPKDSLLALKAYGTERQIQSTDPDNFANTTRREQSKGIDAQVNLPFNFVVGGNFVRDYEDNEDLITPSNDFIKSIEQWGVFIQETFKWKMISLTPGGRYDHNSQAGDSTNPRVQLTADATPWMKLSANAARSFRAPTIDDLYFVFTGVPPFIPPFNGNPDLRPEKAWTYDAGVEFHDDVKSIRFSYFRANITDLIQVDPITFATSDNIGKARRQGLEIEGHQKISDQWSHSLNYTYLENRGVLAGGTDFVSLSYSPRHTLNHTLTWKPSKAWTLDGITRYLDSRYSGNNQTGTKLGSQVTWDTRIGYLHGERTEFFFGVNDVFDKRYEEQANFPLPGRTFYGGVEWHFE